MQTFVVHNYKLPERKKYLEETFGLIGISPCFIEVENAAPDLLKTLYGGDRASWRVKTKGLYRRSPPFRPLTHGEKACVVSHYLAYGQIADDWAVVLEDDAIIDTDKFLLLPEMLNNLPESYDFVVLGGPYPHTIAKTIGELGGAFLKKAHPATNTAVGYAIRKSLAKKLHEALVNFDLSPDYELNYWLKFHNVNVLHIHPYIIAEGSKSGAYESCIEAQRESKLKSYLGSLRSLIFK